MPQANAKMMEECASVCHECLDSCLRTIVHCLDLGGAHAGREHQTLLMDCAAICGVAHGFLHRRSAQHAHTCRACAEVCRACADDCERLSNGDRKMQDCARMCERCAESCERMVGAGV